MRGGIYARLEIKNAIERTYNLTQPPQRRRQVAGSAEGKVAPRIHTRVPEQGRDSRRGARFNHRTGSAAAEGEREREGERVKERERGIKKDGVNVCMKRRRKELERVLGEQYHRSPNPLRRLVTLLPSYTRLLSRRNTHTHTHRLSFSLSHSLSRSPLLDRSFPLSLPNRPNRASFLFRGVLALIESCGCGV